MKGTCLRVSRNKSKCTLHYWDFIQCFVCTPLFLMTDSIHPWHGLYQLWTDLWPDVLHRWIFPAALCWRDFVALPLAWKIRSYSISFKILDFTLMLFKKALMWFLQYVVVKDSSPANILETESFIQSVFSYNNLHVSLWTRWTPSDPNTYFGFICTKKFTRLLFMFIGLNLILWALVFFLAAVHGGCLHARSCTLSDQSQKHQFPQISLLPII